MIKIRRRKKRTVPGLNMTSMPDLIFTVLFFFMIVTHMRKEEPQVRYDVPAGSEVVVPQKRANTINIYIGKDATGEIRIQINDRLVLPDQVAQTVATISSGSSSTNSDDAPDLIVNLRVDKSTPMGIVTDVKQQLRQANVKTIHYSATEEPKE